MSHTFLAQVAGKWAILATRYFIAPVFSRFWSFFLSVFGILGLMKHVCKAGKFWAFSISHQWRLAGSLNAPNDIALFLPFLLCFSSSTFPAFLYPSGSFPCSLGLGSFPCSLGLRQSQVVGSFFRHSFPSNALIRTVTGAGPLSLSRARIRDISAFGLNCERCLSQLAPRIIHHIVPWAIVG